jgi:Zn-dependent protease
METAKIAIALGVLVYSCVLHEIMHAWSAHLMGDDTGKRDGRLTLNPLPHIDPFMTILVPLITWFSSRGTFCFGGARPVMIQETNFRNPVKGMMISAAAGPATNLALALAAALLLIAGARWSPRLIHDGSELTWNGLILGEILLINLGLGLLNLVPIPPLDGSRILRYFLPHEGRVRLEQIERSGAGWLLVVVFLVISDHVGILGPAIARLFGLLEEPMGLVAYRALVEGLVR